MIGDTKKEIKERNLSQYCAYFNLHYVQIPEFLMD